MIRQQPLVPLLVIACVLVLTACRVGHEQVSAEPDQEALARTEFTKRIENFFEYEPLKANQPSQFLIHLTDLTDGSPVEQAEVTLTIRTQGMGAEVARTKARVGKVTGIYVAEVLVVNPGYYQIEFNVKNAKLDERIPLDGFKVD